MKFPAQVLQQDRLMSTKVYNAICSRQLAKLPVCTEIIEAFWSFSPGRLAREGRKIHDHSVNNPENLKT
jgi:hypothetical protein